MRLCILTCFALALTASIIGCGDSQATSVTEDADQAAIDAWKESEKQIAAESENEME